MSGRRIFITGGGSGLGRALAERYARAGWRVCIGDIDDVRGAETLAAMPGATAHYLRCDVRAEADLQNAADWLLHNWSGVDVVVNNAGVAVAVAGGIAEVPLADWQWIIDINLLGVVRGCKVFTPLLRAQGGGHIVNVASMAGLVHPPKMAAYNASKAAVVALSETLKLELAPDNIRTSVVCPAFFRTNLAQSLRAADADVARITQRLVGKAKVGAERIAEQVFAGVARGDFHILTHADGRLAWTIKRLVPYRVYSALMARETRRMMGRPQAAQTPAT